MKTINFLTLLFAITILSFSTTVAQSAYEAPSTREIKIGAFKVKKFDFSIGYETDFVNGLNAEFFINQMPEAQQARVSDLNFVPEYFQSGVCENPSLNFGLTLVHPEYEKIEWRSAVAIKSNRVDAVSYRNASDYSGDYITVNATHSEYTLETAMLYKIPLVSFFNFYLGIGTNIGITNSNETCVFTSLDLTATDISYSNVQEINEGVPAGIYGSGEGYFNDCFDTGSQFNQRIFGQVGAGLKFFQRIEVGMDIKYGYGYRADIGNSINGTNIVSTNLNLRYILK